MVPKAQIKVVEQQYADEVDILITVVLQVTYNSQLVQYLSQWYSFTAVLLNVLGVMIKRSKCKKQVSHV